jgi:hypothetical protein
LVLAVHLREEKVMLSTGLPLAITQWQVVTSHPRWNQAMTKFFVNEHEAREWACLERIDYPHCEVYVESRLVTPWERVPDLPN